MLVSPVDDIVMVRNLREVFCRGGLWLKLFQHETSFYDNEAVDDDKLGKKNIPKTIIFL